MRIEKNLNALRKKLGLYQLLNGNEGVDINWHFIPVSSPVSMLNNRGEFDKELETIMLLI